MIPSKVKSRAYLSNEHHSPRSLFVVPLPQETPKYFRYLSGKKLKQGGWLPADLGAADS